MSYFYSVCSELHLTRSASLLFSIIFRWFRSVFLNQIQASGDMPCWKKNHTPPTQMKCQSTKFLQCCLQWSPNSGKPCVWIFFFQQGWLNPVLSRALIHCNRNKLTPTSRLAKQISAVEWFNHAVYYDFYAMHSKWSPEHEQACGKNPALICFVYFSRSHFLPVAPSISLLFWKINSSPWCCHKCKQSLKKIRKTASPCFHIIDCSFTNCAEQRGLCWAVVLYAGVPSCDTAVSEIFGVLAGGDRKV